MHHARNLVSRDHEPEHDLGLLLVVGFRVQGSGFRVQGSGLRVQGVGFRIQGSGFRVQGFGGVWLRFQFVSPPLGAQRLPSLNELLDNICMRCFTNQPWHLTNQLTHSLTN